MGEAEEEGGVLWVGERAEFTLPQTESSGGTCFGQVETKRGPSASLAHPGARCPVRERKGRLSRGAGHAPPCCHLGEVAQRQHVRTPCWWGRAGKEPLRVLGGTVRAARRRPSAAVLRVGQRSGLCQE